MNNLDELHKKFKDKNENFLKKNEKINITNMNIMNTENVNKNEEKKDIDNKSANINFLKTNENKDINNNIKDINHLEKIFHKENVHNINNIDNLNKNRRDTAEAKRKHIDIKSIYNQYR